MYTEIRGSRKYLTEQGIEHCIERYEKGDTIKEIATDLDIIWNSVKGVLKRRNVYTVKYPNLTEEEMQLVGELYKKGLSAKQISKKLNKGKSTVLDVLHKNNIEIRENVDGNLQRKYEYNQDYFSEVDTPNKAYILGFIYADGYLSTDSNYLQITLNEKDVEILEFINKELNSNKPIYTSKKRNSVSLVFNSRKLTESLVKHGVHQRKTFTIKYPDFLDTELASHFIRGYFDGDGYVGHAFELVGTIDLLTGMQKVLMENCKLNKTKLHQRHKNRDNNIRRLTYGGKNQLKRLYDYLYPNADFYLNRKHEKFLSIAAT